MTEQAVKSLVTLFLCGDVMTGRGVDQIFPASVDTVLYEHYVKDARQYVAIAEEENGEIPAPVSYDYIWGDALGVLRQVQPDARIINLETSITTNDEPWKGKGIHYRMHPDNVKCLTAADIDCCILANNHVLDWGVSGLLETLKVLRKNKIRSVGAGENRTEAIQPVKIQTGGGRRILIFAYGMPSSGVPSDWAARSGRAGVGFLPDLSNDTVNDVRRQIAEHAVAGDIVVLSIHWGSNWGYDIPAEQTDFAHALIDSGIVDVIYGHSSHHARPLEVYKNKLILYGCGDFLNDYEGISGHEKYRDDLALMYFPALDADTGDLKRLEMIPMQIRKMQLHHASREDAEELRMILNRESAEFGTRVLIEEGRLFLDLPDERDNGPG